MSTLRLALPIALAAVAAGTTSAGAARPPVALPELSRTLTTTGTTTAFCSQVAPNAARGVATTSYVAPMSGYVTARLAAADTSNWDLSMIDAASGRRIASSQSFGSHEVTQGWVSAGERLTLVGCRRAGDADRAALSIGLLDVAPPRATGPTELVRVRFAGSTARMATALDKLGLDATESRGAGWIDVLVAGNQRKLLQRTGLRQRVRVADMNAARSRSERADARVATAGPSPLPSGRSTYRTYDDIQTELQTLVAANPDRVRSVTIGTSFQGRPLQGVEIADGVKGNDGRPVYLVVATHHAREWASAEAAMEFATLMARGGDGDPDLANLLAKGRTVIVPLINPDGYVSSRTTEAIDPADQLRDGGAYQQLPVSPDPTTGEPNLACPTLCVPPSTGEAIAPPGGILSYRRKNCDGAVANPNFPCELQYGVDPNRNYGELWGGPGSSMDPTTQTYHGAGPWSEPETQAVHKYSQEHQVTALITLHNVAALVLRPPGTQGNGFAPDEAALKALGDKMASATGYTSQYGFQLYDTTGTTEDWNYAAQGAFGYTIEIGPAGGSFHLPYQKGFVDEWTGNTAAAQKGLGGGLRKALTLAGLAAVDPAYHGIITGDAPAGTLLRLHKDFDTKTSAYCSLGSGRTPVYFTGPPLSALTDDKCVTGTMPPQAVADRLDTTTVVGADGHFVWHVDPSTRPFLAAKGYTEVWRFTCEKGTKILTTRTVNIVRGQTINLGATACTA